MPLNNGLNSSSADVRPNRSAAGRVVPVIPLAFVRPRPVKPTAQIPKSSSEAQEPASDPVKVVEEKRFSETNGVTAGSENDSGINGHSDHKSTTSTPKQETEVNKHDAQVTTAEGAPSITPAEAQVASESVQEDVHIDSYGNGTSEESRSSAAGVEGVATTFAPYGSQAAPLPINNRNPRTGLPPPFVPLAGQYTSRHANPTYEFPPHTRHAHPHRPSIASTSFDSQTGGSHSSTHPDAILTPISPESRSGPQSLYDHSHTHAHHVSEPFPQRGHNRAQSGSVQWQGRPTLPPQAAPQAFHPNHAHIPFRYPPRETFFPANHGAEHDNSVRHTNDPTSPSAAVNGSMDTPLSARSESFYMLSAQSGRRPPPPRGFAPPGHGYDTPLHQIPQLMSPPPMGASFIPAETQLSIENAETLREHMLVQVTRPEFSDCSLELVEGYGANAQNLDAHKIILSRSPVLLSMIRQSIATQNSAKTHVLLRLTDKRVTIPACLETIRYLYGGMPATIGFIDFARQPEMAEHNVELRMERTLNLLATAVSLDIRSLASHAVMHATSLLHWHTIIPALTFALDGGLAAAWSHDDNSEERISTCSSDDSSTRLGTHGSPRYGVYAENLLLRILDFLVHALPSNFYLDSAVPQLSSCPRLPSTKPGHSKQTSRSDPRLSQIRFGDIPIEDHQRPSFITSTISSLLLSLPFPLLKSILGHTDLAQRLGPDTVGSIMRQVVAERERRRLDALKSRALASNSEDVHEGTTNLAQNLYWEEIVEPFPHHPTRLRLIRKRCGIDTPPSSGTDEERKGEE